MQASDRPSFGEIWNRLKANDFKILGSVDSVAVGAFVTMIEGYLKRSSK
jgi:hypothetical protein